MKINQINSSQGVDWFGLINALFPQTVARLLKLQYLKRRCSNVESKYRILRHCNFGTTGTTLAMNHSCLAHEYEKLRYWWMRPIKPLQSK